VIKGRRIVRIFPALLIMCVVTLTAASATTVVPMNLDDMAKASPDIVHGTVVATASHWNEDKTLIVTDVRIRVEDTLKGNAGGEITVTQPGGVVGALRVEIPGVTAFRQDQEAVLFLGPQKNGNYAVTGLMQGQFDVVTDAKTGQRTVHGLSAEKLGTASKAAPPSKNGTESLDAFKARIKSIVHELDEDQEE
jgi:hypothetical protein